MSPLWCALALSLSALPAPGPKGPAVALDLDAFLDATWRGNLELRAQRQEARAADHLVSQARTFPEPVASGGLGAWDPDGVQPLGYALGLSQTLELGGKRRARVAAARAAAHVARDEVQDAWRQLRAEAAGRFATALALSMRVARMRQSEAALAALVRLNTQRQAAGDIGEVAVRQSRVEATHFRAQLIGSEAELAASQVALAGDLGDAMLTGAALAPTGSLVLPRDLPSREHLVETALAHRPDVAAARAGERAAAADLELARANRWEDITLQASWLHSPPNGNATYAQPPHLLAITLALPVPLARVYAGAREAARATLVARGSAAAALCRRAALEVEAAVTVLDASVHALDLYTADLLADADAVVEATAYSYRRGAATLLEVLAAQRTLNEVALDYIDAQLRHVLARIEVERATGTWTLRLADADLSGAATAD